MQNFSELHIKSISYDGGTNLSSPSTTQPILYWDISE
jgi:hypothetical protein